MMNNHSFVPNNFQVTDHKLQYTTKQNNTEQSIYISGNKNLIFKIIYVIFFFHYNERMSFNWEVRKQPYARCSREEVGPEKTFSVKSSREKINLHPTTLLKTNFSTSIFQRTLKEYYVSPDFASDIKRIWAN